MIKTIDVDELANTLAYGDWVANSNFKGIKIEDLKNIAELLNSEDANTFFQLKELYIELIFEHIIL